MDNLGKLENVYIPLLNMQVWGREFFMAFAGLLSPRRSIFPLTEQEMPLWEHWARAVFIPSNEAMAKLIESNRALLEPLPPGFIQFLDYHEEFKGEFLRWLREGGEYRHPGNFPQRFADDLVAETRKLIRQAALGGYAQLSTAYLRALN